MLRDRKIAVFIDVDNTEMEFAQYLSAVEQISAMGEIVCATIYGAGERKHKGVIEDAKQRGFALQLPARTRKRVRKVFDDRIWVDVMDLATHSSNVDTVAVVAYPTDMVYLFSYLRRHGLQVVGRDCLDEASLALVSDVVKLPEAAGATDARAEKAEPIKPKASAKPKAEQPRQAAEQPKPDAEVREAGAAARQSAATSADLVDRVERSKKPASFDTDADLVAEIQKLLAGLE